jgi:hypothetical protein
LPGDIYHALFATNDNVADSVHKFELDWASNARMKASETFMLEYVWTFQNTKQLASRRMSDTPPSQYDLPDANEKTRGKAAGIRRSIDG